MKTAQIASKLRQSAPAAVATPIETDLPAACPRAIYDLPVPVTVEAEPELFRRIDAMPRPRQRRIGVNGIDAAWRE
jgi:hypothetical protein